MEHPHAWRLPPDPGRSYTESGSATTCNRIVWNASNFQTIPQFEAKVRDIVGLYLDPPDRALVLCVDEKSQIQALDRTAPILPLRPGLPERQTHGLQARASRVSFEDGAGVTQTVSVAASSLYEAANG